MTPQSYSASCCCSNQANERNIASLKEALQFAHETGASDREAATNARKKLQEVRQALSPQFLSLSWSLPLVVPD